MSIRFTDNQMRVLNARHHNILVSAAAGSGKTAVLVERIIRMISEDEHPLDIDRLLVVTFTRAAAAQMRERIAKAISQRLEERPDDRHLQRQETLLHRAQIMTIDSFCTFLLRNNCSEIDLDPGFRQIDENESALIEGECMQRFLEEQYAAAQNIDSAGSEFETAAVRSGVGMSLTDAFTEEGESPARRAGLQPGAAAAPADVSTGKGDNQGTGSDAGAADGTSAFRTVHRERFLKCVEYFCQGSGDAELEKLIRKLYTAASSHPYPEAWLESRKKDYAISDETELFGSGWYCQMLQDCLETLRDARREYEVMIGICREPDGPDLYLDTLEEEYAVLSGTGKTDFEDTRQLRQELLTALGNTFVRNLPAVRKKADKERIDNGKKERVQKLRTSIKENCKQWADVLGEDPSLTIRRMQAAAGPIETLIDLTLGYMDALRAVKKERNVIDFSDLEHYALQVLIDRAPDGTLTLRKAAQSYREYYDEVLVDEYQDSNEVQELLLCAITAEPDAGFVRKEDAPAGDSGVPGSRGADAGGFDAQGSRGAARGEVARAVPAGTAQGSYARFMVGDVKQSIYRFRNARPEIFQNKFDTYTVVQRDAGEGRTVRPGILSEGGIPDAAGDVVPQRSPLAAQEDGIPNAVGGVILRPEETRAAAHERMPQKERIDLDQNFRSRIQVLDAANGVCGKIMRREIGGVEYDAAAALKPGASYPEPEPERDGSDPYQAELLLVDGQKKASKETAGGREDFGKASGTDGAGEEDGADDFLDEIAQMNSAKKEALVVAQRIHELVGILPVYDRDSGRQHPARYRDIVILMRSTSTRQDAYREIFEKEGIPLYLEYKGGYFSAAEVKTVLQLLNVIDNPRQDIPLYGVMSSYYGGFTQDEIAQVRAFGSRLLRELDAGRTEASAVKEDGVCAQKGPMQEESSDLVREEAFDLSGGEGSTALTDGSDGIGQTILGQSGMDGGKLYSSLLAAAGRIGTGAGEGARAGGESAAGEVRDPGVGMTDESSFRPQEDAGAMPDPALRLKCSRFLDTLNEWRELSRTMTVRELIGYLVRNTGYEDYVRALPAGQRRAANLHSLLVKAEAFEKSDRAGLFRFLRYIEQMHAFDVDYGEASVIDEHADVVRLTTIHKSKGLEYPICIVSGLGSRYAYKRDTSGTLILDADLGLGCVYTDTSLRCSIKTLRQRAVADKMDRDCLGEELRVLYVAMTRAQEKLILTGYTDDAKELQDGIDLRMAAVDGDDPHLPVSLIRRSGNYLTLILESMEMLRAQGQEPIRLQTVPVSDLRLAELEDQQILGELQNALLLTEEGDLTQLPSQETVRQLERYYAYRYPYENLTGLYTKTTVTELKRAAMVDEGRYEEPGEAPQEMYPDAWYDAADALAETVPGKGHQGDASPETIGSAAVTGELPKPRFAMDSMTADAALTGASRGTAVHRICELLDYRVWRDPSTVTARMFEEKAAALLGAGEVPPSYAAVLKPRIFLPFLHSDIAGRMAAADAKGLLQREQPFVLGIAANRLNPEFPQEETILIQGIIDAFFIEEDMPAAQDLSTDQDMPTAQNMPTAQDVPETPAAPGASAVPDVSSASDAPGASSAAPDLPAAQDVPAEPVAAYRQRTLSGTGRHVVLVDYKTDRVRTPQELIDRYRTQMDYYTEALERMLRLPVTERVLYSFALHQEIPT